MTYFIRSFLRLLNLHRPIADSCQEISPAELSLLLRAYVAHSHEDYLLLPYSDALIDRIGSCSSRFARPGCSSARKRTRTQRQFAGGGAFSYLSIADDRLLDAAREEHLQAENPESWR